MTSIPDSRPRWIYRKMLVGDWLIYQPNDDPDDITSVVDLGEVADEQQAAAIVARLNAAQSSNDLVATRRVPVDSAALYEAVNAWVDALALHMEAADGKRTASLDRIMTAKRELHAAAYALARTRHEQRQLDRGGQP